MADSTKPGRALGAANLERPGSTIPTGSVTPRAGGDKTPSLADYQWVQVRQNGGNEKWRWARRDRIGSARYATIQRFAEPRRDPDSPHLADFYLEGDPKDDAGLAELADGFLRLYAHFTDDLGIPDEAIRLAFSGGRSLHLTIDWQALGAKPSPYLTAALGRWAADLAERFDLALDLGIYTRARQFRTFGSRHEKTGLFKIPLTWHDLTRPIAEIRKMAKSPRPDPLDRSEPVDVAPAAAEELASYLEAAPTTPRPRPQLAASEKIPEGNRHTYFVRRAGQLRRIECSPNVIAAALLAENAEKCDPPLPEAEVLSIAASSADWRAGATCPPDVAGTPADPCQAEIAKLRDELAAATRRDAYQTERIKTLERDLSDTRTRWQKMTNIWRQRYLDGTDKLTLCQTLIETKARQQQPPDQVYPVTLGTIADVTGVGAATVARHWQKLADLGYWTITRGPGVNRDGFDYEQYLLHIPGDGITDAFRQAAAIAVPKPEKRHGGYRRRCPDHPQAKVTKRTTYACSVCDRTLDEGTQEIEPTTFQVEKKVYEVPGFQVENGGVAGGPAQLTAFQDEKGEPNPPAFQDEKGGDDLIAVRDDSYGPAEVVWYYAPGEIAELPVPDQGAPPGRRCACGAPLPPEQFRTCRPCIAREDAAALGVS